MPDKKIPWWMPDVTGKTEKKYINQALEGNYINDGNLARQFEDAVAKLVDAKYAVAVSNCTAGIFISLKALGVGHGDEVIVPDLTFIATVNAVDLTDAEPILVDINPIDLNIGIDAIERAITPKTKAIIPVHVTGRAANINAITDIAKKYNLFVIEDAAEALMSKHNGKCLGTFSNAGCFSFSPNKTITTGQGGIVVTNDPNLHVKLRALKDQGRITTGTGGDDIHNTIGYNFKFTDLQAAVGLGQLTYLETRIKRMKKNHSLYTEQLKDIPEISVFPSAEGEVPQWTDIRTEYRDELEEHLQKQNIDARKYWLPIHRQLAYKLPDDNFPVSTRLSPRSLWLPSAFTLSDDDVLTVCNQIKKFFKTIK